MTLRFKSLCSGSKGNATLIQASEGRHISHVLVDCGLSLRQMCLHLQQAGVEPEQISAIFITHEHADHIGCARAFALRCRTPVWMSQGTHAALKQNDFDGLSTMPATSSRWPLVLYNCAPLPCHTMPASRCSCALQMEIKHWV